MKNFEFQNDTLILFEGFYESNLFNSDTEYYLNEMLQDSEHPETYEITGDNYRAYEKAVCELHVDSLNECLSDFKLYYNKDIVKSVKLKGMSSPQYYNFTTDKLNLLVDFNLRELKNYCFKENSFDFNYYLNKKYTSCSGYISFVDNNIKDFMKTYKEEKGTYKQANYIGIMLEYYFIRAIYDNATIGRIYTEDMHDSETDYKQRVYEQLTELQYKYTTIVESEN